MLTCSKCGHHDQIEHVTTRWGNEIHCHFCGNVAIEGVKARWPFVERKVYGSSPVLEAIRIIKAYEIAQSPLTTFEGQEVSMATKPKCSVEGCPKKAHVKGICDRHYREQFGHSYKPEKKRGQKLEPAKKVEPKAPTLADKLEQMKAEQRKARVEAEKAIPLFQIFLDPELLDELTKKAKAEYRTPEQQAAYLIDKALKKDSYSL
jgi:hypothetical protein